ncbi:MAG: RHS repeat-associated core domain-containing protein, partial [Isosphaerales bacterium]
MDPDGGLYFMRNRYYSPTLQRFISPDPIGVAGGDANLYAYVGNDPTNLVDPLGLGSSGGVGGGSIDLGVLKIRWGKDSSEGGPGGAGGGSVDGGGVGGGFSGGGGLDIISGGLQAGGAGPNIGPPGIQGGDLLLARFLVPFQTLPQDPNETPGEGFIRNGRNWWNPKTGQSLSPNFSHPPPEGPHYDLHSRYPRGKLSIRPSGPGIDFWGPDVGLPEGWLPLE